MIALPPAVTNTDLEWVSHDCLDKDVETGG